MDDACVLICVMPADNLFAPAASASTWGLASLSCCAPVVSWSVPLEILVRPVVRSPVLETAAPRALAPVLTLVAPLLTSLAPSARDLAAALTEVSDVP